MRVVIVRFVSHEGGVNYCHRIVKATARQEEEEKDVRAWSKDTINIIIRIPVRSMCCRYTAAAVCLLFFW